MTPITTDTKTGFRQGIWFLVLRIALGMTLIWKTVHFIRDTAVVESLTGQTGAGVFTEFEALVIVVAAIITLLGAVFIMLGLFTRVASFIQLPVFLIGSLFIHSGHIEREGIELALTAIVPFLLLLFIRKGGGALSADAYLRTNAMRPHGFHRLISSFLSISSVTGSL